MTYFQQVLTETLLPTVICGPSGVGKGTLLSNLKKRLPNTFSVSISHTTREMRDGEIDGKHYHFITREAFESSINKKEFLEYAIVHGNYYGTALTSVQTITKKDLICLLEIDVHGAQLIKQSSMPCNFLFITAQNLMQTLKERLVNRGTENIIEIEKRLKTAEIELDFLTNNPSFFDYVIINDDLDESSLQMIEVFTQWYPLITERLISNVVNKRSSTADLANNQRILRTSKRQSLDFFTNLALLSNVESREKLCSNILMNGKYFSRADGEIDEYAVALIMEYTDISPMNRIDQFSMSAYEHTFKQLKIFNFLKKNDQLSSAIMKFDERWTIGHSIEYFPQLNENTLHCVYFSQIREIMDGVLYLIVGAIRDPYFINAYAKLNLEGEEINGLLEKWDECWDVYFYLKCTGDMEGCLIFSTVWTNMVIFGLDNDGMRGACESGDWSVNIC